jgi:filamentous hemagglutinin family protein
MKQCHLQQKMRSTSSLCGLGAMAFALGFGAPFAALAGPAGGQVASGSATISQQAQRTDIRQNSHRVVIDWTGFDVAPNETVQFHQPSANSAALNRVNSKAASRIAGNLKANGNVVIVNPNGVVFEGTSKVDVNGLIATTADINNADFMAGNLNFSKAGNPNAAVINHGQITAREAGLVGLVAPRVENHGLITAKLGKVQLASGDTFSVDLYGDGLFEVAASDAVASQLIHNTGSITAEGGTIQLSAAAGKNLVNSLIIAEGELRAPSFRQQGGTIIIGDANTQQTRIAGSATANNINVRGQDITLEQTAKLHADPVQWPTPTPKPIITVGGEYLGGDGIGNAQTVTVAAGATLKAGSPDDKGEIIIWSDDLTRFDGQAEASFVETSGKVTLKVGDNARVNTHGGLWLLDPQDFTIAASGGDISVATLETNLGLGDVAILSSGGGTAGSGDIIIADALSWAANRLTLTAARDVLVNAVVSVTGTGALTVNTATTNDAGSGSDAGVSGGALKMALGPYGFTGRVDYSASGSLIINGNTYTIINALGAAGSTTGIDLQGMEGNLSGYYALGTNIDASATSGWNAGAGWAPVGTFTGGFDGLGHTVDALFINRSSTDDIGLFGRTTGAKIRNVGVTNANVTGQDQTAALVGYNYIGSSITNSYATGAVNGASTVGGLAGYNRDNSTISNSYATSTVIASADEVGGLVGYNYDGSSISDSYATGTVNGATTVGGLAGYNRLNSSISSSYATGATTGSSSHVGGLVGYNYDGSSISDSYATGAVDGAGNVGGLAGYNRDDSTISNSYATGEVDGNNGITGGLVGLNNSSSIVLSYAIGNVSGGNNTGGLVGWNHTSSSISNSYAMGDVNGIISVGGLVGYNYDGSSITNSYATGAVNGASTVGGLAGYNRDNSTISNSYATGAVDGSGNNIGGLVGFNRTSSSISASHATGNVNGNSEYTGGLVGSNSTSSSISGSYATGEVDGNNGITGGLVGQNNSSSIVLSYAIGNVSGGNNTGGLVGLNHTSSSISNSYAMGDVNGIISVGGLVANNSDSSVSNSFATGSISGSTGLKGLIATQSGTATTTNSFWNTETSGQATSAAGTGKTTAEMMQLATFSGAGWDITGDGGSAAVWRIYDGQAAPLLRSFLTALTLTSDDVTKTYDAAAYTGGSVSGDNFKTGETIANLLGTVAYGGTGQGAVNAGSYTLSASGYYSGQQGYDISFADGALTVNKAALAVSLIDNAPARLTGEANPSFDLTYTGFKLTDDATDIDTAPTASTAADASSSAGGYDITIADGADTNYSFSYVNGTLSVSAPPPPAILVVAQAPEPEPEIVAPVVIAPVVAQVPSELPVAQAPAVAPAKLELPNTVLMVSQDPVQQVSRNLLPATSPRSQAAPNNSDTSSAFTYEEKKAREPISILDGKITIAPELALLLGLKQGDLAL